MADLVPRFSIYDLAVRQFATFSDRSHNGEVDSAHLKVDFETVPANRCVTVIMRFEYEVVNQTLIMLEFSVMFQIHAEDWRHLVVGEQKVVIPLELARHLAVITIGSGRGILYEKLRSERQFAKVIWPIVDLTKVIAQDIEFEMDSIISS